MTTVTIFGWSVGFRKVKFTELLRRDLGYSLSSAKAATDAVLDNQRLELYVRDTDCDGILFKLSELGARFVFEDQVQSS
jgi:hypothetical protein